jgi:hypothetical protein
MAVSTAKQLHRLDDTCCQSILYRQEKELQVKSLYWATGRWLFGDFLSFQMLRSTASNTLLGAFTLQIGMASRLGELGHLVQGFSLLLTGRLERDIYSKYNHHGMNTAKARLGID